MSFFIARTNFYVVKWTHEINTTGMMSRYDYHKLYECDNPFDYIVWKELQVR